MLQLSDALLGKPVLSLRTGAPVAGITEPVINPNNLKIEGFYCQDSQEKKLLILLPQDIRDIIPQGVVVNDHDVLAEAGDLVRLRTVIALHFELIGKPVVTASGERLGKVEDYATDLNSFFIQRLYVSQSIFKSFTNGNFGIDRNHIVDITSKKIIVNDLLGKVPSRAQAIA